MVIEKLIPDFWVWLLGEDPNSGAVHALLLVAIVLAFLSYCVLWLGAFVLSRRASAGQPGAISLEDVERGVGRCVVAHQQPPVLVALIQQRIKQRRQIAFAVAGGEQDVDQGALRSEGLAHCVPLAHCSSASASYASTMRSQS